MEEAKSEVKETRTPISAEVLEEVLLRFLGAYIVINQIVPFLSIVTDNTVISFYSNRIMFTIATHFVIGIFLIVAAGKWIKLTHLLKKLF